MGSILAIIRGILLVIIVSSYVAVILVKSAIFGYNLNWSLKMRRRCLSNVISMLGVRVEKKGDPLPGNYIFIGNHRSYLDPIIALCDLMALPVAKSEVSKWPLLGYSAKVTGIVFVKRENRNSRKQTLETMLEILQNGNAVLIYPEGTTHDNKTTIDFKVGAFRLAADHDISIIPMMIDYENKEDYWIGNDTFLPHFIKCISKWRTNVSLHYGPPIQGNDKRVLRTETRDWIDSALLNSKFQ